MERFEVSVIIPVYNAEKYLLRAVASASQFDCVKEIILVEDGSKDASLNVCKDLVQSNSKLELLRHEEGKNLGAAASRNLGVQNSSATFIAFLDADDYYLPNRFDAETKIAIDHYDCIAGFTASEFDSSQAKTDYQSESNKGVMYDGLQQDFWLHQSPTGHAGTFTTNSVTIRQAFLTRIGRFDSSLRVSQDTELWLRLGLYGRFYFTGPVPTSVRYVYVGNRSRIGDRIRLYRPLMYQRLLINGNRVGLTKRQEAIYSSFLLVHTIKNLPLFNKYSNDQRIGLARTVFRQLSSILTQIPWIYNYFFRIRPTTRDV